MTAERTKWLDQALCRGATVMMYDLVWPDATDDDPGPINGACLANAVELCDECPVRRRCLELVMGQEDGTAAANRFGVAGGMTPKQRWSLGKRGSMRCEKCSSTLDPIQLRAGTISCFCGHSRTIAPIPWDGDSWSKRHTTLARRVLAFMIDGIEQGVLLPSPTRLADEWGVHHNAMCRVYVELGEDGLIERNTEGTTWVRTGEGARHAEWKPRHLR